MDRIEILKIEHLYPLILKKRYHCLACFPLLPPHSFMASPNFDFFQLLNDKDADTFVKYVLQHQGALEGEENEAALQELKLFLTQAQAEIDRLQQETRFIPQLDANILGETLYVLPPGYFQVCDISRICLIYALCLL